MPQPAVTVSIPPAEMAKVKRALEKWGAIVEKRLQQALYITAEDVRRDAADGFGGDYAEDIRRSVIGGGPLPVPPYKEQSNLMPHVRTGDLRSSVRVVRQSANEYHVDAGETAAPYGRFVEFGTSRSRPHPFMHPAAEMNRRKWDTRVRKAIKDPTGVSE